MFFIGIGERKNIPFPARLTKIKSIDDLVTY